MANPPGGDSVGTFGGAGGFVRAIYGAADVIDAVGLNKSGKALESIIAQQKINKKNAKTITKVMDEYINWFDRGGVAGLDDIDLAYIGWISEAVIQNPEQFDNPRRAVRDTMEGVPAITAPAESGTDAGQHRQQYVAV
jgi:hypothetical protein